MTILSRIFHFFPTFHIICILFAFLALCYHVNFFYLSILLFTIYLLPIICLYIHNQFYTVKEGTSHLSDIQYSPWWGIHQLQALFNAVPTFEALLRIIPGAYSYWLRLWGGKIGKKIYWTPLVEITDRNLIEIGDNVIFGHKVACFSHVITRKDNKIVLYAKRIKIGNHVFLGAGSRLGPGAHIDNHMLLHYLTDVKMNQFLHENNKI